MPKSQLTERLADFKCQFEFNMDASQGAAEAAPCRECRRAASKPSEEDASWKLEATGVAPLRGLPGPQTCNVPKFQSLMVCSWLEVLVPPAFTTTGKQE